MRAANATDRASDRQPQVTTYERKGGGEFRLETLLYDAEFRRPDGRVMSGRAGDVLVTRVRPLPMAQWIVEQGCDDELYQLKCEFEDCKK